MYCRLIDVWFHSIQVAAISLQESPAYDDIDEENKADPNQSPDYAQDIFNYLKEREVRALFFKFYR